MKKFLTVILFVTSLSAFANLTGMSDQDAISAQETHLTTASRPVIIYPFCNWGPFNGQCTLINSTTEDIVCHFSVSARSLRGSFYSTTQHRILYRGMSTYEYVYAINPSFDPLIHMSATAQCSTLR